MTSSKNTGGRGGGGGGAGGGGGGGRGRMPNCSNWSKMYIYYQYVPRKFKPAINFTETYERTSNTAGTKVRASNQRLTKLRFIVVIREQLHS